MKLMESLLWECCVKQLAIVQGSTQCSDRGGLPHILDLSHETHDFYSETFGGISTASFCGVTVRSHCRMVGDTGTLTRRCGEDLHIFCGVRLHKILWSRGRHRYRRQSQVFQNHHPKYPIMASPPLVALITAGSAGLGAATAKLFASSGLRVVINYASNASRAEQIVQELETLSPIPKEAGRKNFASIRADLSKRDDVIRLVDEATAEMGRLDVLFSNGGWTMLRNFQNLDENMDEGDWDKCFTMNVKSHLWLMHASRKWLDESKGAFITTASIAGVKPSGSSLVRTIDPRRKAKADNSRHTP